MSPTEQQLVLQQQQAELVRRQQALMASVERSEANAAALRQGAMVGVTASSGAVVVAGADASGGTCVSEHTPCADMGLHGRPREEVARRMGEAHGATSDQDDKLAKREGGSGPTRAAEGGNRWHVRQDMRATTIGEVLGRPESLVLVSTGQGGRGVGWRERVWRVGEAHDVMCAVNTAEWSPVIASPDFSWFIISSAETMDSSRSKACSVPARHITFCARLQAARLRSVTRSGEPSMYANMPH